jgi:cytoskeletal protein CcmA (bactofilin family)
MWRRPRTPGAGRSELSGFIDEGSEIEGKYTFSGTVMLNGKFHGEIASADTLIIGERGVVNANVRAGTVVVSGELVGNVVATDRVELKDGARVFGDVESPVVVVAEGVFFEGHCRMTTGKPGGVGPADSPVVALGG